MPPKKSAPKNAFYYFMEDFRVKEERRGIFYKTMSEVANAAGPEWQKMSVEQRRPYEQLKEENKTKKNIKKYTNLGESISVVQRQEEEGEREKKIMKQNIDNIVSNGNDYVTKSFFIAHVNHYCYCNTESRHIPAEISIVQFSLQDGVGLDDCYHVILDTGTMPIGYRLAAITVSDESHAIPVPPHEGALEPISQKNIRKAFEEMTDFLRKHIGPRQHLPPVYVDDSNFEMAKDVFKNLYDSYGDNNPFNVIKVYSLSYLFFVLRNAAHSRVSNDLAFPFATIPQAELEKDIYDYVKGIACEYHNMTDDAFPHCTLSKCFRKVFIICDHTCYDLNIELIPGRHIPRNARPQRLESRPASQLSNAWPSNPSRASSRPSSSLSNGNVSNNPIRANSRPASSLSNGNLSNTPSRVDNRPPSSLSTRSGTQSYAAAAVPVQPVNPAASTSSRNPTTAAAVAASAPIRKPQSTSIAMNFKPQQPPDLANDFPSLGAPTSTRPQTAGRGRGRCYQLN